MVGGHDTREKMQSSVFIHVSFAKLSALGKGGEGKKELWRKETTKQQQREHLTSGCVIVLGQFLEERIKEKKNNMDMVLGNWLLCEGWVKGIDLFSSVIHEWAGEIKWARF